MLPLRIALSFLTILSLRLPDALPEDGLRRSTGFFPLVGWLLGTGLIGFSSLLLAAGLPAPVAAILLVGTLAWATRGLHLDGLADLLDGLGGGQNPERRLAIMKDSAIGAFGVIGLILLCGLKISCLAALFDAGTERLFFALCAGPAAGRWAMAGLACGSRYPRSQGTGHAFVGKVKEWDLLLGFLFLLPLFFWHWPLALASCGGAAIPALYLRFRADRALGGVTGDVLGAACELGEVCAWLAVLGMLPWI